MTSSIRDDHSPASLKMAQITDTERKILDQRRWVRLRASMLDWEHTRTADVAGRAAIGCGCGCGIHHRQTHQAARCGAQRRRARHRDEA